ncbi:MAG: glycoside hydrolase domain-containing protein [Thermoguttaceae bacterium]
MTGLIRMSGPHAEKQPVQRPYGKYVGGGRTSGSVLLAGLAMLLLSASRGSAGEWLYYECTLQRILSSGGNVVLMLGVEHGEVREHALNVASEPYTVCRIKEHGLKVEGTRLRGPMHIQVGPATEKIELDVALDKDGTYRIAYGCPDPSRKVEGNVTIERQPSIMSTKAKTWWPRKVEGSVTVEVPRDTTGNQWVLWLQQAFGPDTGLGLVFDVDRAAKTLTALPAVAAGYNGGRHPVDASKLTFDGTNLEGEVGITVVPSLAGKWSTDWVPAHRQSVDGLIKVKAALDGKERAGSYSAVFGIEKQRQGQVAVKPVTAARMRALAAPIVSLQTPWRVWMVTGPRIGRGEAGNPTVLYRNARNALVPTPLSAESAQLSKLPPADWRGPDYDDGLWGRYTGVDLFYLMGGYGCRVDCDGRSGTHPALMALRTRFKVADPERATDLKIAVEYLGGVVVYVNGVEMGRGHLPEANVEAHTPATHYPIEAYTVEDGTTPLPPLYGAAPEAKWLPRYQARVRRMTVAVPAGVLVKGANVLAVELHRAPVCGPTVARNTWSHLGICDVRVTSDSGSGVIAYKDALRGTWVWSAQALEQVTEKPVPRSRIPGGWSRGVFRACDEPMVGISMGNPADPVRPLRILVPRNGVGHGQTVLSDPDGLRGVSASVRDLRGPGGAVLPARSVRVRYGTQGADLHWCDALMERPLEGATTIPVWLEVQSPRDQPTGWYVSTLSLEANGKTFQVPVQVFVTAYTVPDARNLRSVVGVMHSPEAVANAYGVQPWSDAHFALMARSLEMAGQLGNDIMYVPVIIGTHMGYRSGLIRWMKTEKGLQPDFTLFEKYLDLYLRYCAPPKAISLYVWSPETATEVADAYEHRAVPTRTYTPKRPLQVTQWDPRTGETTDVVAPGFLDEGAEAFWKPMLDGVHAIVRKRGWSERVIMLGCGGDIRPSQKTGEVFRQWAPYARWDIYSHFSGDPGCAYKGPPLPGSAPDKFIAIGNLEVGLREGGLYGCDENDVWLQKLDFLVVPVYRAMCYDRSPPPSFLTYPMQSGRLGRLGLDFWPENVRYAGLIWGVYPVQLLGRGPDGPVPTVRLQTVREALQDFEPRLTIIEALAALPAEQKKMYRALLDDYRRRYGNFYGSPLVPEADLSLTWPAYAAQVYRAAEELTGIKTDAKWEEPPK